MAPSVIVTALVAAFARFAADASISSTHSTPPIPDGWQFHVAPMQCYTHAPLRRLHRLLSPDAALWTEMEKADDWLARDALPVALARRFGPPDAPYDEDCDGLKAGGGGLTLQLGGDDPHALSRCAAAACRSYGFREVNLNCGCPSVEKGGASSFGASLMKRPAKTAELVRALRASVPENVSVSVKCRIGVFDRLSELRPVNGPQFGELLEYLSLAEESGADHVVLHARPAVLSGLNPSKNRCVPELDYEVVQRVARDLPRLRVTLNGGLGGTSDLRNALRSCSQGCQIASHMSGRWMLRRPLDLAAVQDEFLAGEGVALSTSLDDGCAAVSSSCDAMSSSAEAARAVDRYVDFVKRHVSSSARAPVLPLAELCLPMFLVAEQLREDYEVLEFGEDFEKGGLLSAGDMETVHDTLWDALAWMDSRKRFLPPDRVHFKRLSSAFKRMVGKKVANKWKRNRSEV